MVLGPKYEWFSNTGGDGYFFVVLVHPFFLSLNTIDMDFKYYVSPAKI